MAFCSILPNVFSLSYTNYFLQSESGYPVCDHCTSESAYNSYGENHGSELLYMSNVDTVHELLNSWGA